MAATAAMRASLVLNFEDKLTGGLGKLEKQFEQLKQLGKELSLGRLENGVDYIQRTISATRSLAEGLDGVGNSAREAEAKFKHMLDSIAGAQKRLSISSVLSGRTREFSAMDARALWGGARVERPAGGGAGGMGGMMAGIGTLAAGYVGLEATRSYASFEDIARSAAIASGVSGPLAVGAESKRLQALFSEDALRTAQSGTTVGNTYSEMVGQGITPAEAERLLAIHSRVATAYGINPATLTPATVALEQSFLVNAQDMGGALAAMATAAMSGRFKLEDFARSLPGVGAYMKSLYGDRLMGRAAANEAFAAEETVMRYSPDPGSGNANFMDMMNYLTAKGSSRSFALESKGLKGTPLGNMLSKYHVTGMDLPAVLAGAREHAEDPITAVIRALRQKIKGLPPDVMKEVLGAFFGNQQAGTGALALIQNWDAWKAMEKQLTGVSGGTLDKAFEDRMAGAEVQTRLLDEELAQLNRRLGVGLMPLVKKAVYGLDDLNSALRWVDEKFPGLSDNVVSTTGAVIGMGTAAGVLGLVLPKLGKGLITFLTPLRSVAAALWGAEAGAFGASSVLGVELPAALVTATAAMTRFNAAAMANPLVRTGMFAAWLYGDLKDRMGKPGDVNLQTMSPQQLRSLGISSTGSLWGGTLDFERMNQEDVGHHGPGLGVLPAGWTPGRQAPPPINSPSGAADDSGRTTHEEGSADVAAPVPAGRVDVYVWADPNGVPIIVRTDGTGVNLPQGAGAAPDPGKTLGRP